ncbi:MAG TPA: sigma-70 family RNA polymerase sigma factor [Polyangia bacterium]
MGRRAASVPDEPRRSDELLPLARAAADGDPEAAATLIAHVGSGMLNVIRRVIGRGSPDVDDIAQDAVIALMGSLVSFRADCSVIHFSRRVALLTALAARRRARLRQRWSDLPAQPPEMTDDGPSPLASTLAEQRRTLVRNLLDELPDVIAEALALHFVLGYTVEEIADSVSVSPNTVWSRLRLGKRALRRRLENDEALAELRETGE